MRDTRKPERVNIVQIGVTKLFTITPSANLQLSLLVSLGDFFWSNEHNALKQLIINKVFKRMML